MLYKLKKSFTILIIMQPISIKINFTNWHTWLMSDYDLQNGPSDTPPVPLIEAWSINDV